MIQVLNFLKRIYIPTFKLAKAMEITLYILLLI